MNGIVQLFLQAVQVQYHLTRPQACALLTSARQEHGAFDPYARYPAYTPTEAYDLTHRNVRRCALASEAAAVVVEALHTEFKRSMSTVVSLEPG